MEKKKKPGKRDDLTKEQKKLRATADRILKRRIDNKTLEDELADIKQISQILQSVGCADASKPPPRPANVKSDTAEIGSAAPGLTLLDPSRAGYLFTENSLQLSSFLREGQTLFGRPIAAVTTALFRKLLVSRIYELRSDGLCDEVSLYVVHLMATTPCPELMSACEQFLRQFPVAMKMEAVLPLVVNLGFSADALWGQDFTLQVPKYLVSDGNGRDQVPYLNIEKLMNYLNYCVEENLLACDESAEALVVALSQIALDGHIRGSPLLATVTRLISQLATRCSVCLGCDTVAEWLMRRHHHPLNQMEVCRLVVRGEPPLHRALLRRTLSNLLNTKITLDTPLLPKDVRRVVRTCKNPSTNSAVAVYAALMLLQTTVPCLKIARSDVGAISKELGGLEAAYGGVLDMSDMMRLHAVCAQLRGLLMMAAGIQQLETLNDEY